MTTDINCEFCRTQLFDLMAGHVSRNERRHLDAHIESCEDCAAALGQLWELEAAATRWQDQRVPRWDRRARFFEAGWQFLVQMGGAFASILLVVVIVAQLRIDTSDGFAIRFGPDYVTRAEVSGEIARTQEEQAEFLSRELERLREQQAAGDRLVLTSLLHTSRRERRDDLSDLVSALNDVEARRDTRTRQALQYLISTQQEDRKDIQQLHEALQLVGNSGGTL